MPAARSLLINPLLLVILTFGGGFLFWYLGMADTSILPGIAPRHESLNGIFLFFLYLSAFTGGMMMAQAAPDTTVSGTYLLDDLWVRIGWVLLAVVFVSDYLYLRSGIGQIGSLQGLSYTSAIHEFSGAVRGSGSFGISSFNNLFPIPLVIGATMMLTRRDISSSRRWQGMAMFASIFLMTLVHGAVGFGRIWFLFSILTVFVVWVIERQPRLRFQLYILLAGLVVGSSFILIMELLRNVGLTAQANNINVTDPRIIRLALTVLTQAYVATDINNAMIVFDCQPPGNIVSTIEVVLRPLEQAGIVFPTYFDCNGWTSIFGTVNFFAAVWWDWGLVGIPLVLGIGYAIQRSYRAAIRPLPGLGFAEVLFPNVLFGAAHLTRTVFLGSTEFLLPAGALLMLYLLHRLGTKAAMAAPA